MAGWLFNQHPSGPHHLRSVYQEDTPSFWQSRSTYRVLVGKPEGKRPLGRPRRRWEDNINMDLREMGCDPGDWMDLAEYRYKWRAYVRVVMNLRVP